MLGSTLMRTKRSFRPSRIYVDHANSRILYL
jgi:hypothetical protein